MAPEPSLTGHRIEHIWAYVAVAGDGDEGVCGFRRPDGMEVAMVCSDEARRDSLRPLVEAMAAAGHRIECRRFDGPMVVEEVFGG